MAGDDGLGGAEDAAGEVAAAGPAVAAGADADPHHHLQTRQLLAGVRKRIAKLQEQRNAIDLSLVELNEIDRQCEAVLASRAV